MHQSEGHGMLIGKDPSHEVRAEKCVMSGCFVVLLSGSPEMVPEIVCQQDVHLYLTYGIDTKGKIAALLWNV